jgi:predicted short-subunit dehydrogenase-like oxidoreductase (DUF2520 family)
MHPSTAAVSVSDDSASRYADKVGTSCPDASANGASNDRAARLEGVGPRPCEKERGQAEPVDVVTVNVDRDRLISDVAVAVKALVKQ